MSHSPIPYHTSTDILMQSNRSHSGAARDNSVGDGGIGSGQISCQEVQAYAQDEARINAENNMHQSTQEGFVVVKAFSRHTTVQRNPIKVSNYFSILSSETCLDHVQSSKTNNTSDNTPKTAVIEQQILHPAPKLLQEKVKAAEKTMLAADAQNISRGSWLIDSGSNVHVINDSRYFVEMHPYDMEIGTACGEASMGVAGEGTVVVPIHTPSGDTIELELKQAVYVPTGRCNLISLSLLDERGGFSGDWGGGRITFKHGGELVFSATITNGLFHVPVVNGFSRASPGAKIAGNVDYSDPVWAWHCRLGHPNIETMRKLLANSIGMNITDAQLKAKLKAVCPTCATTKAIVKIPRDPARRQFDEPGIAIKPFQLGNNHSN